VQLLWYHEAMKIYLARHGRTNYNDLGLNNADPIVDVHLTSVGVKQVENLAEKLKLAAVDQIFVSELKRTQQTAYIINKFHKAPIQVDERLNDIRTGYEGKPATQYWEALDNSPDRWAAHLNGGESLEDVKIRARAFIDDLRDKKYQVVLVVTSRDLVNALYGVINSLTNEVAWALKVDKASCIELEI
jgi:broad specificity phosphatase PhoE